MVDADSLKPERRLVRIKQLRARWGNVSGMFIERKLRSDPDMPRPIKLGAGRLRLFYLDEIERYEQLNVKKK